MDYAGNPRLVISNALATDRGYILIVGEGNTDDILISNGVEAEWRPQTALQSTAIALATTGADVNVASAATPFLGQVLMATGPETATWQNITIPPAVSLATTGDPVIIGTAGQPSTGQILKATSPTSAAWQNDEDTTRQIKYINAADSGTFVSTLDPAPIRVLNSDLSLTVSTSTDVLVRFSGVITQTFTSGDSTPLPSIKVWGLVDDVRRYAFVAKDNAGVNASMIPLYYAYLPVSLQFYVTVAAGTHTFNVGLEWVEGGSNFTGVWDGDGGGGYTTAGSIRSLVIETLTN
jgi:hypothetical protein